MIKEIWEQICENQDVRQNLSRLRQELKEKGDKELLLCMEGSEDKLIGLLQSEDAKTRKNAALLMGDLGRKVYLAPIFQAYEEEQQLFVKSAYLAAMKNYDYREFLPRLKDRLEKLTTEETLPENQKHTAEEIRELSSLIVTIEGVKAHTFVGWDEAFDVILLTNRNFPELTLEELQQKEPAAQARVFGAGVMASVNNLDWIDEIRSYQELLFSVKGMKVCPMDAVKAAEVIANSRLLDFLSAAHEGQPPYYFRVELKSRMELDKKSAFVKKMAAGIERLSGRKLINTTSNYEIEIRLIENKEGSCNVLVKLYTLNDERFSYRKEVIPTSIRPFNAALTVKLTSEYMKEGAQVLDPFCGVGTMLIERHKAVKAKSRYGLDIQEEAVEKAKINTKAAGQVAHYINRDFFTFQHEYLFDEIITNMPFRIGRKTEDEIHSLYKAFFPMIKKVMKEDGVVILYSHNADYVKRLSVSNGFVIEKTYEISKKEGTYVFVLMLKQS